MKIAHLTGATHVPPTYNPHDPRITHTHRFFIGRTERLLGGQDRAMAITDSEGFRRPVWLALWGGMICQVKGGEPCFASSRNWQVDLSCFHRRRSMAGERRKYGFTDLDSVDRSGAEKPRRLGLGDA